MLAELREVYEGQIEAKDAPLAAKDETIAELRRRAAVAEAEVTRRQAQDVVEAQEVPAEPQEDSGGVLERVRRWWGDRG